MSIAIIHSRASAGVNAPLVTVETHISNGLPKLSIVGLPETAVKESKDRVRSALLNANFEFPARRITINLGPADLPKEGCRFDLPIALGILAASGQIPQTGLADYEFAGELALSGELRAIHGSLPFALASKQANKKLILPSANATETRLVKDLQLFLAHHLLEVCAHLSQTKQLIPQMYEPIAVSSIGEPDLAEVHGQAHAKRALEIAACGGHSMLMIGAPGTGKTMLATRLPSILPPLSEAEALEVAMLRSLGGKLIDLSRWRQRPFRSPHHTCSAIALVGGGSPPLPGEISLAHHGILFLDELPEYNRHALESLREPLESGAINISRAARQVQFPAQFQLVAAMNPCPCGYAGNRVHECRCTSLQIQRYRNRISGPLLDRIDLHVEVSTQPQLFLTNTIAPAENSIMVRNRVITARAVAQARQGKTNAALSSKELTQLIPPCRKSKQFLDKAIEKLKLSGRATHRILKVARTIADLTAAENITIEHLAEAISYRQLEIK